ncbi:MAG: hypothetical protein WEE36_09255 [Acidimicrobiia bacterium]
MNLGSATVAVAAGKPVVVVRCAGTSHEEARATGLRLADQGLDLLAIRGLENLSIKGIDEEHLTWWPDQQGLVIRLVSIAPLRIDVPPVRATVLDKEGNEVASAPEPEPDWHESFRYFRLSQVSEDLFDAFRNAYLALESMLSDIAPQQTKGDKIAEPEGSWFRRALVEADKKLALVDFAPAGTSDPVDHLFRELYIDMRSAMSHAKSGRKVLLPRNEVERAAVTASLGRLVQLYLALAKEHLGARRRGGGMFAAGFRMMNKPLLGRMEVFASDDPSSFDPTSTSLNPAGGELVRLTSSEDLDDATPFVLTRLYWSTAKSLKSLSAVRRVGGAVDGAPAMASVLEGDLELGLASRFEVLLGTRGVNLNQPRTRYLY